MNPNLNVDRLISSHELFLQHAHAGATLGTCLLGPLYIHFRVMKLRSDDRLGMFRILAGFLLYSFQPDHI